MQRFTKVAIYARFSSDNQRTESIDAQIRAITKYCKDNNYLIVDKYIDEAKSATTDKRPDFQRMIKDSEQRKFDAVIVHKLDRFARNRYDSAIYKQKLKKNKVKVYSVLENLNDSPESVMMEAMLEGMSEYYSKNLAREVMKGMTENALKGKHTGGITPLGYDLDENKKMIINPDEAKIVKTIFDLYDKGFGYGYIISYLNEHGYKTKRGNTFGKNSLYDLIKNEKYTGVYIYNKSASKDMNGERNSHIFKSKDKIIRIADGCPAIISHDQFVRVNKRRKKNYKLGGAYNSKEFYLLSGKIRCGICGKKMIGDLRFSGGSKSRLSTYRCNTHRVICKNKEINKDYLDGYIADLLGKEIFASQQLQRIKGTISKYVDAFAGRRMKMLAKYQEKIANINIAMRNLMNVIERGILSEDILMQLDKYTADKNEITIACNKLDDLPKTDLDQLVDIKQLIGKYKSLEPKGQEYKSLLQRFIGEVIIYPYDVEVELLTGFGIADELNKTVQIKKRDIYKRYNSKLRGGDGDGMVFNGICVDASNS